MKESQRHVTAAGHRLPRRFWPSAVQCQIHFFPLPLTHSEKLLAVAEEVLKETSLYSEALK